MSKTSANLWEIAARKLACNEKAELRDLHKLVSTMVSNILGHRDESKYRVCKFSNAVIKRRLLAREGGVETLTAFGFTPYNSETGRGLILLEVEEEEEEEDAQHNIFAALVTGLGWFDDTVNAMLKGDLGDQSVCAEVLISIKMPVGAAIVGGFMESETISSVVSFCSNYFSDEKKARITLRQPHDPQDLAAVATSQTTLQDLGLGISRVGLVASLQSDESRAEALVKPQTVIHGLAGNGPEAVRSKAAIAAAVRKRQDEATARIEERKSIISAFQDDRSKARERLGSNTATATEKDIVEKES